MWMHEFYEMHIFAHVMGKEMEGWRVEARLAMRDDLSSYSNDHLHER